MKNPKSLKEALATLNELSFRSSKVEEWVTDFIEDLINNMDAISTINFVILDILREIHGLKKGDDYAYERMDEYKKERPLFFKYLQENKEEYGMDTIKKLDKVEEFFSKWEDI